MPEQGIVKWYSIAKGYGFIQRQAGGEGEESADASEPGADELGKDRDIFVHHTDVASHSLSEGERVCFEVVASPKGPKARNVTVASGACP